MDDKLVIQVRQKMAASEVLRAAASVRADGGLALALGGAPLRGLSPDEIAQLEALGNTADDWSRVRVADGFDGRRVRQSHFHGTVALGRFAGTARLPEGIDLPAGVYRSSLADCTVGHGALVSDVRLLARAVVGEGAVVFDCGTVAGTGPTAFGNGEVIPLGPETGGREVAAYAEITVEEAAALTQPTFRYRELERYQSLVAAYLEGVRCDRLIVEAGAVVRGTAKVLDAYVGPHAVVDGAVLVRGSTVLSSAEERTHVLSGSTVCEAILQWGSRVESGALVERTVLAEYASVERHGKVLASVLGPDTAVAEGEVTSSLVGPLVGFHHQAMLIAALWPAGRGNVSHGASVGANHTSRAPDQEAHLGEGTFLGLGVNIKYPLDLSRAPYCVIACGVNMLPQRILLPFSLVNVPSAHCDGVPPYYNEIVPGWVLSENMYALKRTEWKHRSRRRAKRSTVEFEIFRPETVETMREACRLLEAVPIVRDVYTDRHLEGLGKNYLTEENRQKALWVYRNSIHLYGLLGLLRQTADALAEERPGPVNDLLDAPSADRRWEHQRRLLKHILPVHDVAAALAELPDLLDQVARSVERAKDKDHARGQRVIDGYTDLHPPVSRDPVVQMTWAETKRIQAEVKTVLTRLAGGVTRNGHAAVEAGRLR